MVCTYIKWSQYIIFLFFICYVLVIIKIIMCDAFYLICCAHKEKQQLNEQNIINKFQLSEILTRADFYCNAQIINPSIKPSITACTDIDSAWLLIYQLCPQRYAKSSTIKLAYYRSFGYSLIGTLYTLNPPWLSVSVQRGRFRGN